MEVLKFDQLLGLNCISVMLLFSLCLRLFLSNNMHHILTLFSLINCRKHPQIVSEYDQEILQSQTADNPVAPRGRVAQPSRDTRKTS